MNNAYYSDEDFWAEKKKRSVQSVTRIGTLFQLAFLTKRKPFFIGAFYRNFRPHFFATDILNKAKVVRQMYKQGILFVL